MKSLLRFVSIAVVFATCSFASGSFRPFTLELAPGSSPDTVRQMLGAPSAVLAGGVWVYFEFARSIPNVANPAFDTLVIAFEGSRVTAVKITDGRVVRQLLAQEAAQKAALRVAAK
jgi:hypothetical protein